MKIAIVLWELSITGGTQRQALELARSLQKKGHRVEVFCHDYNPARCFIDLCNSLSIKSVRMVEAKPRVSAPPPSLRSRIVFFFKMYAVLLRDLVRPGKKIHDLAALVSANGPYDVVNLHDYEAYKVSRVLKHPHTVWMMNDLQRAKDEPRRTLRYPLRSFITWLLLKRELRHIQTIAVLDERNRRLAWEKYGRRARVVRSGIDHHLFDGFVKKPSERIRIFASSIFFPYRRFEDLVDAAKILVDRGITQFAITINGIPDRAPDYYRMIKERIHSLGLENYITMTEGLPEKDLKQHYVDADIFVFPNDHQTWGLAVFEAMLAGCACIVSRGAGAHEVLTDGENAILVPPLSSADIAHALERLITDSAERARIVQNGTAFVRANISWDNYADQMFSVFESTSV